MGLFDFLQEDEVRAKAKGKALKVPAPEATPNADEPQRFEMLLRLKDADPQAYQRQIRDMPGSELFRFREYYRGKTATGRALQEQIERETGGGKGPFQETEKTRESIRKAQEALKTRVDVSRPLQERGVVQQLFGKTAEDILSGLGEGFTPRDDEAIERDKRVLQDFKQRQEAKDLLDERLRREKQLEVKPTSRMGLPGGLRAVFDGAGIPRKDLVTGAVEIINKNNLMPLVGPGATRQPVDFASGLTRIVKDEFSESFEAFTREWRSTKAPQEPEKAPAAGEAKAWDPLVQGRQRLREMYQQLGEERELRNWIGIIAFAILAFTVGPRSATAFFNRMKDDGTLGDEIKSLEKEIEEALKLEKEKRQGLEWDRRLAAREKLRGEAREEQRDFQWEIMNERHRLLVARAEGSGSTDRETLKRVEADWHRAVVERNNAKDFMDKAKATMEDDLKPQAVRDAALLTWQSAAADYQKWSAKMESINEMLEKYTQGLPAPGQR